MTCTVELFTRSFGELTIRQSLWRRILLRQQTVIRFVMRRGSTWFYDDTGRIVDDERVLSKLRAALVDADDEHMRRAHRKAVRDYAIDDLNAN